MNNTVTLTKLRKLIRTYELKHFMRKPYGLEMLLFLYEIQKNGQKISIDEVFKSLVSEMPRREAFGIFLNELEQASLIMKKVHATKRSRKTVELSNDVMKALDSLK